jgi:predicted alpha/beta hydrolase
MQGASDILPGWFCGPDLDGREYDFYVRQLWDWKGSADVAALGAKQLGIYGEMCAWTLARAHARSGDRVAIAAYLGQGDHFDGALARFCAAYADQNERDYAALLEAMGSGRLHAETGI